MSADRPATSPSPRTVKSKPTVLTFAFGQAPYDFKVNPQDSTPAITLTDAGDKEVTLSSVDPNDPPNGPFPSDRAKLSVKQNKKTQVHFKVVNLVASDQPYTFVGIALNKDGQAALLQKKPPADWEIFPSMTILQVNNAGQAESTLILDIHNTKGGGEKFLFNIVVMSATGELGLIDPKIVNQ